MEQLHHQSTKRLETPRLILRRFTADDAEPMFKNWAGDSEVTKHLTWSAHKNVNETKVILEQLFLPCYQKQNAYEWAIELKALGEPIGSIGVHGQNELIRSGELGYCIGRRFWGQGYTLEALNEVMRFLFLEVNFNRLEALHEVENVSSGRVMQKAGMRFEGIRRQVGPNHRGVLTDCCAYAILKEDYIHAVHS